MFDTYVELTEHGEDVVLNYCPWLTGVVDGVFCIVSSVGLILVSIPLALVGLAFCRFKVPPHA